MPGHTAWPTIADGNSIISAMGQTAGTAVSTTLQNNLLASIVESVTRRTHRTFVPTTETREFDGSGTGTLEIDEYITISTVELVGWFGISPGLALADSVPVHRNTFPKSKLQIYQGSVPAFYRVYIDRFPIGRSNVRINALWGYDVTIPADLWLSVAYQYAGVLLNWKSYKNDGFLIKWEEADVTEVRSHMDPFKFFNTGYTFKEQIKFYSKPASFFVNKTNKPLM